MPTEWSGNSIRKDSEHHIRLLQPVLEKWIRLQKTFSAKDGSFIYADSENANNSLLASAAWKTRGWSGICELPFDRKFGEEESRGMLDIYLTYEGTESERHRDFLSYCIETKMVLHNGLVQKRETQPACHQIAINSARSQVLSIAESDYIGNLDEAKNFRFIYGAYFATYVPDEIGDSAIEIAQASEATVNFVKEHFDTSAWYYPSPEDTPVYFGRRYIGVCLGLSDSEREYAPGETP